MKMLKRGLEGATAQPPAKRRSSTRADKSKEDEVCPRLAKRVEECIVRAGQITGTDLAAETGISINRLRAYTQYLEAAGLAHKMRGRKYRAGLWIPGPERAGEHERGVTPLQLRITHWQRAACRIDLAEALLFNRFPALTAPLLADGATSVKNIRLPKAFQMSESSVPTGARKRGQAARVVRPKSL